MTQHTDLSVPDLERIYDLMAHAIDEAGPERSELMLTKLALLLANALGDAGRVQALVQSALQDL